MRHPRLPQTPHQRVETPGAALGAALAGALGVHLGAHLVAQPLGRLERRGRHQTHPEAPGAPALREMIRGAVNLQATAAPVLGVLYLQQLLAQCLPMSRQLRRLVAEVAAARVTAAPMGPALGEALVVVLGVHLGAHLVAQQVGHLEHQERHQTHPEARGAPALREMTRGAVSLQATAAPVLGVLYLPQLLAQCLPMSRQLRRLASETTAGQTVMTAPVVAVQMAGVLGAAPETAAAAPEAAATETAATETAAAALEAATTETALMVMDLVRPDLHLVAQGRDLLGLLFRLWTPRQAPRRASARCLLRHLRHCSPQHPLCMHAPCLQRCLQTCSPRSSPSFSQHCTCLCSHRTIRCSR